MLRELLLRLRLIELRLGLVDLLTLAVDLGLDIVDIGLRYRHLRLLLVERDLVVAIILASVGTIVSFEIIAD